MQGLLLIDKEKDITSFGAVAKVKWLTETKRVGHTGTLDPMATGLLPVLVGRATVLSNYLLDADKEYIAGVCLGKTTDTLDITGTVLKEKNVSVSKDELLCVAKEFLGEISQVPPMYSAIKKDGVRLYELARKGKEVERAARTVNIKELEIYDFDGINFNMRVLCSKGTYIRSLAADIGERLKTGATLTSLRRTKTAGFDIKDAVDLNKLTKENVEGFLTNEEEVVRGYKKVFVSFKQAVRFSNGGELSLDRLSGLSDFKEGEILRVCFKDKFVGLGKICLENNSLKVLALLNFIK